jgi:hypothetical protein
MKKWALLGVAFVLATAVLGWSAREDEVVATSGAQIKVIKTEKGYVLEVSWSGGQEEDIAILGVMSPKVFGARAWAADPIQEGENLVWHAGPQGTIRIPVIPTELDTRLMGENPGVDNWIAGLSFVANEVTLAIRATTNELPTKGNPFAGTGGWKRNVVFRMETLDPLPSVLRPSHPTQNFDSLFPTAKIVTYTYDPKTELPGQIGGRSPVAWKGASPNYYPRPTLIQVAW